MKVFISWSGEKSKAVGTLLKDFISMVIQAVNPIISTHDIREGSVWYNEIHGHLGDECIGVLCLTQENKDNPWMLFEAGALARSIDASRVAPFLIDLKPTDIIGPLAQFNNFIHKKKSIRKLIQTINASLECEALDHNRLEMAFETYWTEFHTKFEQIKDHPDYQEEAAPPRDTNDILSELLTTVRTLDMRTRKMVLP